MTPIDEPPLHPLRSRIWAEREIAHRGACELRNLDSGEIAHVASGVAGRWCFNQSASRAQLETVIQILSWMHCAAMQLERLEAPDGP